MENITIKQVLFSIVGDCVCKIVCQFVGMGSIQFWVFVFLGWWLLGLGLLLVVGCWVSYWVCYLGVMFGIGFVCLWVGKYVIMPFNSREGVSVGLFTYRF